MTPFHDLRDEVHRAIEAELGFGIVPNVFRAMDTWPPLLAASWAMYRAVLLDGTLPRELKEMVGVVVSVVRGSPYARDVHLASLAKQGVSREVLDQLLQGDVDLSGQPPRTLAVLAFARDAATDPRAASVDALAAAGLTEAEVLEVVGAVQLFSGLNVFTDLLRVPVDDAGG